MSPLRTLGGLFLGLLACTGCSTYAPVAREGGPELAALSQQWGGELAHPGSILLAPVALPELAAPDPEDMRGPMRLKAAELEEALIASLGRVLRPGQRVARTPLGRSPEDYARAKGFEGILYVEVERWNALFVETTGWWYPNALFLGWYFWPFGAWTIADEVYGVDCALRLTLRDAASEGLVEPLDGLLLDLVSGPELARPPREEEVVHLPRVVLSDGERGLDFFGTWTPGSLDPDQWAEVALLLEPFALRYAGVRAAAAVAQALRDDRALGDRAQRYATTHAVVVGIGEYEGQACAGAKEDAQAVRDLLAGVSSVTSEAQAPKRWLPRNNLDALLGGQASVGQVTSAARVAAERARSEDTLVFYFAGRGRSVSGADAGSGGLDSLELLCADGPLSLGVLAEALASSPARRRVIVLDCDFRGGGARGQGPESFPFTSEGLRQALRGLLSADRGLGLVVLACDPSQAEESAQTYAFEAGQERGLLTTYLLRGLAGEADSGGDGLSAGDLQSYLERHVGNLSEVALPHSQHPFVVLQDALASLRPGGQASD